MSEKAALEPAGSPGGDDSIVVTDEGQKLSLSWLNLSYKVTQFQFQNGAKIEISQKGYYFVRKMIIILTRFKHRFVFRKNEEITTGRIVV